MPSELSKETRRFGQGESIRLDLTNDQRKIIKDKIGADAEYVIISKISPSISIQGHLADDAVID